MAFPLVDGSTGETTDVHAGMVVKRVRVATTAAGTLATSFENGDTVDGVVLATGDRILVKDQAAGAENGIYKVNASGAPTRSLDFDEDAEVLPNTIVIVEAGTANGGKAFRMTNTGSPVVGTTALTFTAWATGSPTNDSASVATQENTTSDTFTDLSTSGPAVTVTTGTKALVIITSDLYNNTANDAAVMSFAVSGASTVAAADARGIKSFQGVASMPQRFSGAFLLEGLTAGSNTFTAKYRRQTGGTAQFGDRDIAVIDMGS